MPPHLGEVRVYAHGALRTLTLGNQVEQTCLDLDHPARLLSACRERLSRQGILVSNHWSNDFETSRRAHAALDQIFARRVLHLHVTGGNAVAFAFAEALPGIRRNTLYVKRNPGTAESRCRGNCFPGRGDRGRLSARG